MSMPEAAVDENHALQTSENKIRLPRQPTPMKPISEAKPVNKPANNKFGPGILRLYPAHPFATFLRRKRIHPKTLLTSS